MLSSSHFAYDRLKAQVARLWVLICSLATIACLTILDCSFLAPCLANESSPYAAYVINDEVYVRSGPGQNYYPTQKLKRGDRVEVYRHDPGGWYAIRPPEGSFSWVSGEFVKLGEDGSGVLIGDRVVARVGSAFSEIRDVIQVRLNRGEAIEILEAKQFNPGPAAQTWYKINPPSGEFRWIHGKFVSPDPPSDEVEQTRPRRNLLVPDEEPAAAVEDGDTAENASDNDVESGPAELLKQEAEPDLTLLDSGEQVEPKERPAENVVRRTTASEDALQENVEADPLPAEPKPAPPAAKARGPQRVSPKLSGEEAFHAELDQLDLELSAMVAGDPSTWSFEALLSQAKVALDRGKTAIERGHARLLLNKIEKFSEIKRRMNSVAQAAAVSTSAATAPIATVSSATPVGSIAPAPQSAADPNRVVSAITPTPPATPPTGNDDFDGVGRLARVRTAQPGLPGFALTDANGAIQCFVTPAPGINLRSHVGQYVGINGNTGFVPQFNRQNVTARRITVLGSGILRR